MNIPFPHHGKRNENIEPPISSQETKNTHSLPTPEEFKTFKIHLPNPLTPYDCEQIKDFLEQIITGLEDNDFNDHTTDYYKNALTVLAIAFATQDKTKLARITGYPYGYIERTITNLRKNKLVHRSTIRPCPIHTLLTGDNGVLALTLITMVATGEMQAINKKGHWYWKNTKQEKPRISSQETPPTTTPVPHTKNPDAVALGKLGGLKGGKARADKLTPEQRSAIASQAAQKRWAKHREQSRISSEETCPNQYPCSKPSTTESPNQSNYHQAHNGDEDLPSTTSSSTK